MGCTGRGNGCGTHPDSVRRVRPPKTTMPKTLAALARSQYATAFEDVSRTFDFVTVVSAWAIASRSRADVRKPRWQEADASRSCIRACLKSLANSLAFEYGEWRGDRVKGRA